MYLWLQIILIRPIASAVTLKLMEIVVKIIVKQLYIIFESSSVQLTSLMGFFHIVVTNYIKDATSMRNVLMVPKRSGYDLLHV